MQPSTPSRTALRVALRRAAHQLHDRPLVFADPIAVPILGAAYREELARTPQRTDRPWSTGLRAFIVARSRYAEDLLARAVANGTRQYILLGAGLDTFAYRNPYPHLRVFEVDHPATQQWKHKLLRTAGIGIPGNVTYVPVDFEHQSLPACLDTHQHDAQAASVFAWLGVVPYLTRSAFQATLSFIAAQPAGSALVLDYSQPRSVLPPLEQLAHDSLAARVLLAGEPFRLHFTPADIALELQAFHTIEDLGSTQINLRYFSHRTDHLRAMGSAGRLLSAWT